MNIFLESDFCYDQSMDICDKNYRVKYYFKRLKNQCVILIKCVLLTGGLDVSFSIYKHKANNKWVMKS